MWRFICLALAVLSWDRCNADKRPMYIIGHMANQISRVDAMLAHSANAIEADLSFDKATGEATRFFHGIPCDCLRLCEEESDPLTLMRHLRDVSTPGNSHYKSSFTGLVWIDLKLDGVSNLKSSGEKFSDLLINVFKVKGSKLNILLGVMHPSHFEFIEGLMIKLRNENQTDIIDRIGTAGSQKEHFADYVKANTALNLPQPWIDEGATNCFAAFFKLTELKEAIKVRDEDKTVSKVCRWTIDTKDYMRNALSVGTDAIITNDPEDLHAVLQEPDFSGIYRLATSDDYPYKRIPGHGPYRLGCHYRKKWWAPWAGTYQCWKDKTVSGDWCYTSRYCGSDRSSCLISDPCE